MWNIQEMIQAFRARVNSLLSSSENHDLYDFHARSPELIENLRERHDALYAKAIILRTFGHANGQSGADAEANMAMTSLLELVDTIATELNPYGTKEAEAQLAQEIYEEIGGEGLGAQAEAEDMAAHYKERAQLTRRNGLLQLFAQFKNEFVQHIENDPNYLSNVLGERGIAEIHPYAHHQPADITLLVAMNGPEAQKADIIAEAIENLRANFR